MKVKNAGLLSKEEYENNGSIPMICGGYWLGTPAPDGKVYFVWSDTNSAICGTIPPDAKLGVRPVLMVEGLESAPRNEHGSVMYGGKEWHILNPGRIISRDILGMCTFSSTKNTDIARSDVLEYIKGVLLPELERNEPAGAETCVSHVPAADTEEETEKPTIVEEIGRKPYSGYADYGMYGYV
jgi:hypothetical protein